MKASTLFEVKKPGAGSEMQPASLNSLRRILYVQSPDVTNGPQDVIAGDQALLIRLMRLRRAGAGQIR